MTPEHEMIILKYIEQVLHKNFTRNSGYKITPEEHWVETCIQELFDEWKNGGYNFATRKPNAPGSGSNAYIGGDTSILVFHGKPKPHECTNDPVIANNWC